ncbi:MAG: beta-ketoacyl-ACP synthase II [Candidatus Omnitrophica bacterium]|nr:beta-ketoacyl-ACP synthase II [Candidatus Omnitrophota bacterium]
MRRVVVTGCGIVSPVGIGKKTFWESLRQGKSGISQITQFDASAFDSQIAGEAADFVPPSFLPPKDLRRTPRFVQFALQAAVEAFEESGIDINKTDPYRIGTIVGSGVGSLQTVEREVAAYLNRGPRKISPFLIPMMITNEAAGNVAIRLGLKGVNVCTVTACASGAHAVGTAYRAVQSGEADAVVTGGTESSLTPLGVGGFCALKALSTRNDAPTRASRPFDRDRDGFVMAEGAGMLVLEELEHARRRGAEIFCELSGYGATCDAYHITAPSPEGEPAAKAMQLALQEAKMDRGARVYLNTHGTSTQLNDRMETKAIKRVFGPKAERVCISSTKSMTGHTLGAAGAIEFIVCCFALRHNLIPPTINYENPDPECDLDYTPNHARESKLDCAMSNSLGFGGHNASLLATRYR